MENINRSQALYLDNPYCTEFSATIVQSLPQPGGTYALILDQTYFYPTGGGQDHDTGIINDCRVMDVERDENTGLIGHVVQDNLPLGPAVCKVDWEQRLRNMQHHSGQHLLTQCILRQHGYKTISANINGYTPSTLDILADQLLSDKELDGAEELANQIIYENRIIKTYFVDAKNVDKIPLRRPPKVKENIRIVEIDGYDYSACGGTHCARTGEIGIIKILKNERINNKTRISFIAGHQALQQFRQYQNIITGLAAHLNVKAQEITNSVIHLTAAVKLHQKEIGLLKRDNLTYEAGTIISQSGVIGNNRFIACSYENRPVTELRLLAELLKSQGHLVAILTSYERERLSIVTICGKETRVSATDILRRMLGHFEGKGGGDTQIAQGGGSLIAENLNRVLNAGLQSVRELI